MVVGAEIDIFPCGIADAEIAQQIGGVDRRKTLTEGGIQGVREGGGIGKCLRRHVHRAGWEQDAKGAPVGTEGRIQPQKGVGGGLHVVGAVDIGVLGAFGAADIGVQPPHRELSVLPHQHAVYLATTQRQLGDGMQRKAGSAKWELIGVVGGQVGRERAVADARHREGGRGGQHAVFGLGKALVGREPKGDPQTEGEGKKERRGGKIAFFHDALR